MTVGIRGGKDFITVTGDGDYDVPAKGADVLMCTLLDMAASTGDVAVVNLVSDPLGVEAAEEKVFGATSVLLIGVDEQLRLCGPWDTIRFKVTNYDADFRILYDLRRTNV